MACGHCFLTKRSAAICRQYNMAKRFLTTYRTIKSSLRSHTTAAVAEAAIASSILNLPDMVLCRCVETVKVESVD